MSLEEKAENWYLEVSKEIQLESLENSQEKENKTINDLEILIDQLSS